MGYSIIESSSEHYYLAGIVDDRSSGSRDMQIALIKTQLDGDTVWTKLIGDLEYDEPTKLIETDDGSILLIGRTANNSAGKQDYLFMKLNPNGEIVWRDTYGFQDWDFACDAVESDNNSVFIVGQNIDPEGKSFMGLIQIDSQSNILNEHRYYFENRVIPNGMISLSNGDMIIAGEERFEVIDSSNTFLTRIETGGDTVWTLFTEYPGRDLAYSIVSESDSTFIITGIMYDSSLGRTVPSTSMYHTNGDLLWNVKYNQFIDNHPSEIIEFINNTFLLVGCTTGDPDDDYNIWLSHIDKKGIVLWDTLFELPYWQVPKSTIIDSKDQIVICGEGGEETGGLPSISMFKISGIEGQLPNKTTENIYKENTPLVFPNPVRPNMPLEVRCLDSSVRLNIRLYNYSGQLLQTIQHERGKPVFHAPSNPGLYFIWIYEDDLLVGHQKLIVY